MWGSCANGQTSAVGPTTVFQASRSKKRSDRHKVLMVLGYWNHCFAVCWTEPGIKMGMGSVAKNTTDLATPACLFSALRPSATVVVRE